VKVVAVLAVIFQSILSNSQWMNGATDEEVPKMSDEQRTKLYKLSQDSGRSMTRVATTQITLELHDEHGLLLVRAVLKGEERFVNFVE
jgi:hypothetical protein